MTPELLADTLRCSIVMTWMLFMAAIGAWVYVTVKREGSYGSVDVESLSEDIALLKNEVASLKTELAVTKVRDELSKLGAKR
jgi:hypothetical protein